MSHKLPQESFFFTDIAVKQLAAIDPATSRGTILWIHGYTMDSSVWGELWQQLPQWNHLAVDLPGHGLSAALSADENLKSLAQKLGNLAAELNADHLIGLSFGGIIALQVAIEKAEQFKTLTLAASGLGAGPLDANASERNMELMSCFQKRGAGPWMTELWMQSPPDIFKGAEKHPQLFASLKTVIDKHCWQELNSSVMQQICNSPQTATDLKMIKADTLILIGEEDMPVFKRCAQLIRRGIAKSRCHYLDNVGHLCLLEEPQTCAPLIAAHLQNHCP